MNKKTLVIGLSLISIILSTGFISSNRYLISKAQLPDTPDLSFHSDPNLTHEERSKMTMQYLEDYKDYHTTIEGKKTSLDNLTAYYRSFSDAFLTASTGDNCFLSPVNTYLTLSMAAQCNAIDTNHILSALHVDSLKTLQAQNDYLWSTLYENDVENTFILQNSVWLNKNTPISKNDKNILSSNYHADIYKGAYGARMNKTAHKWICNNTMGNLVIPNENHLDSKYDVTILSVLNFNKNWKDKFNKSHNSTDDFTLANHDTVRCDYMHDTFRQSAVIEPGVFSSISLNLSDTMPQFHNLFMVLLLPDEGITVEEMLASEKAQSLLCDYKNTTRSDGEYEVALSLPKIDISTEYDLNKGLEKMGLNTATINGKSNNHLNLNEDGCQVTSLIQLKILTLGAGNHTNDLGKLNFNLNRPFAFAVMDSTNDIPMPVIVGKINDPTK